MDKLIDELIADCQGEDVFHELYCQQIIVIVMKQNYGVKPILIDLHRVNIISSEKTEKIFSMELESSKQTMNLYI